MGDQASIVEDKHVDIGRLPGAETCLSVSLIPFEQQRNRVGRAGGDRDGLGKAAAEQFSIGERQAIEQSRPGRPGGLVGIARIVACRGDISHALCFNGLDGLRNNAILEERLVKIRHVIANDFAAGIRQRQNAVGKILFAVSSGVEGETRSGRNVVDDLHHRAAFVRAAGRKIRKDLNVRGGRQCAIGFVRRCPAEIIEAV